MTRLPAFLIISRGSYYVQEPLMEAPGQTDRDQNANIKITKQANKRPHWAALLWGESPSLYKFKTPPAIHIYMLKARNKTKRSSTITLRNQLSKQVWQMWPKKIRNCTSLANRRIKSHTATNFVSWPFLPSVRTWTVWYRYHICLSLHILLPS